MIPYRREDTLHPADTLCLEQNVRNCTVGGSAQMTCRLLPLLFLLSSPQGICSSALVPVEPLFALGGQPFAAREVMPVLIEPKGVVNTGDAVGR